MKTFSIVNFTSLFSFIILMYSMAFTPMASAHSPASSGAPINLADVGFETPESVLYDARNDVYLVSNINGGGLDEDNNGFISKVSPAGEVLQLKWITGGVNGVTLNAPKGTTIVDDTLYVADINVVRKFNLTTGQPSGDIAFPAATFLNDLTSDKHGVVYVSDSGFKAAPGGLAPSGTDAIYKIARDDSVSVLAQGNALLHQPNGLAVLRNGKVQVVSYDPFNNTKEIYTINRKGERGDVVATPVGLLDGVVLLKNGRLLVSSWEDSSIYLIERNGVARVVASDLPNPADIGWDSKRQRILVPLFSQNRVVIVPFEAKMKHEKEDDDD